MAVRDLTRGSVARLIPVLGLPVMLSFALNALYTLADMFFVSRLGGAALAGLSIALNTFFYVVGLGHIIGTGGLALLSQAFGAGRHTDVTSVFQQLLWLTLTVGLCLWAAGGFYAETFVTLFTKDPAVAREGTAFLRIYCISFFTQIVLIVMSTSFRALGDFVLPTVISSVTVVLNVALDPVLIFGWDTIPALGIAGAGWGTAIGQGVGVLAYAGIVTLGLQGRLLALRAPLRWNWAIQRQVLRIGVPVGLRLFLLGGTLLLAYRILRNLGSDAIAATGLGMRLVQVLLLLLGESVGLAVASLAGQNFGARNFGRVKAAIGWGLTYYGAAFVTVYGLILWNAPAWVAPFAQEPAIRALAARYLLIIGAALPFFGVSVITGYAAGGLGRTTPPLLATAVNFVCCFAGWTALTYWEIASPERIWQVAMAALDIEAAVMAFMLVRLWKQLSPAVGPAPA